MKITIGILQTGKLVLSRYADRRRESGSLSCCLDANLIQTISANVLSTSKYDRRMISHLTSAYSVTASSSRVWQDGLFALYQSGLWTRSPRPSRTTSTGN